jgi:hypothetical protein
LSLIHDKQERDVSSAADFYQYADEHFDWANTAKTERERAIFLRMAAAWLEVAQGWEASATLAGVAASANCAHAG